MEGMATTIPEQYQDLFTKKAFAHLATVGADGKPQVTPVWVDYDGTHVRFNYNPYRYVQVRGRVVETTEKGADAHIDALAKKYLGQDKYPFRRPGEVRVLYKVLPESVEGM